MGALMPRRPAKARRSAPSATLSSRGRAATKERSSRRVSERDGGEREATAYRERQPAAPSGGASAATAGDAYGGARRGESRSALGAAYWKHREQAANPRWS